MMIVRKEAAPSFMERPTANASATCLAAYSAAVSTFPNPSANDYLNSDKGFKVSAQQQQLLPYESVRFAPSAPVLQNVRHHRPPLPEINERGKLRIRLR